MEHSGTESDKAVSTQPDIIPTAAPVTGEPDISSSPPPDDATGSADHVTDHVTTEDTPNDAVDTPTVAATNQPEIPSEFCIPTLCIIKLYKLPYLSVCCFSIAKKVGGIFDSASDDDDFFTPSITKSVPKTTAPAKKELSESDKKALRYLTD